MKKDAPHASLVQCGRRRPVGACATGGWLGLAALAVVLAGTMSAQGTMGVVAGRGAAKNGLANQALQDGRVEDAATLLRAAVAADAKDGMAHQLLCRVYYAQNEGDEAIRECELAVASPADNAQASDNQLWLGRAYGLKARHAGPIAGFTLARKVQASFARAVELNPANVAALNDLGEFDVSAPFLVGGGMDKAQALATRMMAKFPGPAHLLLARIAVANGDLNGAESEFKQEIAVAKTTEAWNNLGYFYQTHDRADDALAAVQAGLAVDRTHGPALVDAASILMDTHRAADVAERCLRSYLASRAKTDEAPAFKVHLQLGKLLAARGDAGDASREYDAAAAMAPEFARAARPAQGL